MALLNKRIFQHFCIYLALSNLYFFMTLILLSLQDLVNGFGDHHQHPLEEDQEASKLNAAAVSAGSLSKLPQEVQETFAAILRESILDRRLY